jgi:hypothetical protein
MQLHDVVLFALRYVIYKISVFFHILLLTRINGWTFTRSISNAPLYMCVCMLTFSSYHTCNHLPVYPGIISRVYLLVSPVAPRGVFGIEISGAAALVLPDLADHGVIELS